jgi:hypothetical protein
LHLGFCFLTQVEVVCDVLDSSIYVCSPAVLALFSDNFDIQGTGTKLYYFIVNGLPCLVVMRTYDFFSMVFLISDSYVCMAAPSVADLDPNPDPYHFSGSGFGIPV